MAEKIKIPTEKLKIVFSDVIRGFSIIRGEGDKDIYVRHFTNLDAANVDEFQLLFKEKAAKDGLPNEKEKLELLAKDGLWDPKKDALIAESTRYIKNLTITRSKLFLKSEMDRMAAQIQAEKEKLEKLEQERLELVGTTVESYGQRKANERYIFLSLFKDSGLNEGYYSTEEYAELTIQELSGIIELYNSRMSLFASTSLKTLAVSNFFLNFFYLCEDNPYTFFGKPVVNLTYYQVELFGYGRYFKQILSDTKTRPPDEMMDEPDQIIEWYEANKNAEKVMKRSGKGEAGASSIVGATKDDLKRLGLVDERTESTSLAKEAAKKGGNLNMEDIMKLHGLKRN